MLVRSGFLCPLNNEVDPTGPLGIPLVRLVSGNKFGLLFGVYTSGAASPLLGRSEAIRDTTFMCQSGHRHFPTVSNAANEIFGRHLRVRKKHLIKRGMAIHLFERLHLDSSLFDIHHKIRQPLVLGQIPVSPNENKSIIRVVGTGRPHLLAIH